MHYYYELCYTLSTICILTQARISRQSEQQTPVRLCCAVRLIRLHAAPFSYFCTSFGQRSAYNVQYVRYLRKLKRTAQHSSYCTFHSHRRGAAPSSERPLPSTSLLRLYGIRNSARSVWFDSVWLGSSLRVVASGRFLPSTSFEASPRMKRRISFSS